MRRKNFWGILAVIFSIAFSLFSYYANGSSYGPLSNPVFVAAVALAVPMLTYGSLDFLEIQRIYNAEKRIPDLLRDISNYTSFGVPLSEAFQRVGANSYGVLTSGVRRVSSLVSAGVNFDKAVTELGYGLKSPKIAMVSKILQKSNQSGSNTSDVIWILSEFSSRSELLRGSRIGDMKNYNLVMIISFAVFLFVILFLDVRFLSVMFQHSLITGSFIAGNVSSKAIENTFSLGVIVQAIAIGVISGVLSHVRITSGFLLSGILIAVTTFIFLVAGVF